MAFNTWCRVVFLALLCPQFIAGQNKYVQKVKTCYEKDKTKAPSCILQYIHEVVPLLNVGVPEMKIPVMDPLKLALIDFNQKGAAIQAEAKLTNLICLGASKSVVTDIKLNKAARTLSTHILFPTLNVTGDYVINGTVMMIELKGNGKIVMNMVGAGGTMLYHLAPKGAGMQSTKTELDLTVKHLDLQLNSLNKVDTVAGAINNIISDNSQLIFDDIKPILGKVIAENINKITENLFLALPPNGILS